MGVFDFLKKKGENKQMEQKPVVQNPAEQKPTAQNAVAEKSAEQEVASNAVETPDAEKEMVERLCSHAGNTIAMLKSVLTGPKGLDMYVVTLYASGLAGIACHEAVKATGKAQTVIETKDGKKYFMGDEVNKYLHENKYSVTGMIRAITEVPQDQLLAILTRQAQTIGSEDFVICGNMDPKDLYKNVKNCWDGIFNNMTAVYCKSPEEWPVFFGIVLQNVIKDSLPYVAKEAIFNTAADVVCALSKMDQESL